MDPLTAATSFASIVGLICNYMSEVRAASTDKHNDFILWLEENHHNEIKQLILGNRQIAAGLESMFRQSSESIMSRLDSLDRALTAIATQFDGFKDIATALNPTESLSQESIKIIEELHESGGSTLLEMHFRGQTYFQIMDGRGGNIVVEDERFLEDDLKRLCDLEFLLQSTNKSGNRVFIITRQAARFIENMKRNKD